MNYLDLFKKVSEFRIAAKRAHQLALSNRLSDDNANKIFERFDKKAFSFEKAVVEAFDLKGGDHVYYKPGLINENEKIDKAYICGLLNVVSTNITNLQDSLKSSKYKVVDKSNNKYKNLSNGARSLLTKTVKEMTDLVEIYTPEVEEEAK